ncbi:fimbrial protein [Serratia quinivorans]|uniref:fimbrial protein n=2 Tax=Serratia quinivorans TaxID=137545 RepID=UPI0021BB74E2|nr:fimbrial protein [Serratia quinivorans]
MNEKTSRYKKITCRMLTLLGLWIASTEARADYCTVVGGTRTTAFSSLVIQRDTPVGTVLAEYTFPLEQVWDCTSAVGVSTGWHGAGVKAYGTYNSYIGGRVYDSGVPGVGYLVSGSHIGTSWWNVTSDNNYRISISNPVILDSGYVNYAFRIKLIKTGPARSGIITSKRIAAGVTHFGNDWDTEVPIYINNVNVTALACSLTNTTISVPLGDVQSSAFSGITTTAGDKTFNLGLSCDKDANINVALAGTQNADTTDTSVLALTNAGQSGTASGVGVQLLYGSVPLKLNNNILLKTSAGGQETLPFSARYYQTKTAIGAGLANSSATLNITYQ